MLAVMSFFRQRDLLNRVCPTKHAPAGWDIPKGMRHFEALFMLIIH